MIIIKKRLRQSAHSSTSTSSFSSLDLFPLLPKCPIPRRRSRKCAHGQSAHAPLSRTALLFIYQLSFSQHSTL